MKNLQFGFAFLLALVASSFTLPDARPTNLPGNHSLPAQVDFFLKIEGVDGESTAAGHEKWIELNSLSLNTAAKTVAIKRQTSPVASPILKRYCAAGKHLDRVIIHQRTASGGYMTIELENVLITSYQTSANNGRPIESLSINYTKIVYQ